VSARRFRGAGGFAGITRIARDIGLECPRNRVHLAILSARTGKCELLTGGCELTLASTGVRAQTTPSGYLETFLAGRHGKAVRVIGRLEENCGNVRFTIKSFTDEFDLAERLVPLSNDWTVTGKGAVIARFVWEDLAWGREEEERIRELCDRVAGLVKACS
jgi:hypothetical protein